MQDNPPASGSDGNLGLDHDHGVESWFWKTKGLGMLGRPGHQDTKELGAWQVTHSH